MAQLLLVEDEAILSRNMTDALTYAGHQVAVADSGEDALAKFDQTAPDLALLDLRLPGMGGLEVLRTLRARGVCCPIVIMTAHGNVRTAVEAMKTGADDFLTKPVDLNELRMVVERLLEHQRVVDSLDYFKNRERADSGVGTLLGTSPEIDEVRTKILRLAHSPALKGESPPSVLITGETGTGKDLVARAIHYEGPRSGASFVHVNCTAVPDELFEAELFGHVKGAFTSAQASKKGLMEIAEGGTIFFDEVGHMKIGLQSKLLTALEHRTIRPVGGTKERRINVHVISATNRDLEEAVRAGEFRSDLYHRLRVVPIPMPSLRGRFDDIELLANHFLRLYRARFGSSVERISSDALATLKDYDWPGNVRELSHALENAVLMTDAVAIEARHLPIQPAPRQAPLQVEMPGSKTVKVDFESGGHVLEDVEYIVIKAAMELSGDNLSRAARMLGITRDAVRYRLNKYETSRNVPDDTPGPG